MSLNPREQRILAQIERALEADDPRLCQTLSADEPAPWLDPAPAARIWALLLAPRSLLAALATTLTLQVGLAVGCEHAARAGNLWLIVLAIAALPVAMVPLILYTRDRP